MSSAPSTARSWLPTRQSSQRSRDQRRAGVGLGAVADHVAEAPDLVDAGLVDRREDGFERRQVGVDVAEDGYAQAGSVPRPGLGPYDWPVTATDSIAALRGAVEGAARALRDGEPTEPAPDPRAPAEARARRLQLQRGDAARRAAGRQPARRRRAAARRARGRLGAWRQPRADRGRRPGLRQPLPRRLLVPAGARGACWRPARTSGRRRPQAPERVLVEFVSANPTGPLHVGARPPRRLRRLAGAAAARRPATRSSASTTSTTPAARSTASPTRSRRGCAGEEPPEDGYAGEYVTEIAERLAAEGVDPADREALGARGVELMLEEIAGDAGALRRPLRQLVLRAQPLRERRGRGGARPSCEKRGHTYRQRGRALAADHRLRRRQGPGPDPLQRRADLPRRRTSPTTGTSCSAASSG